MANWILLTMAYILSGLICAIAIIVITVIHYSKSFGLDETFEALDKVLGTDEFGWQITWWSGPVTMMLWPIVFPWKARRLVDDMNVAICKI